MRIIWQFWHSGDSAYVIRRRSTIFKWSLIGCAIVLGFLFVAFIAWVVPLALVVSLPAEVSDQYRSAVELRKGLVEAFTALGVVSTLIYAARGFKVNQNAHLTGRFENAAKQIAGDSEAEVISGIYAMALIADIWPQQRQACIEVICSHVRRGRMDDENPNLFSNSRVTALNIIANRLRPGRGTRWDGHDFNFSGALLEDADFSKVVPTGACLNFKGARFVGRLDFSEAKYIDTMVNFQDAIFSEGCNIDFGGSIFRRGSVAFNDSKLESGLVTFDGSYFYSSCAVDFAEAEIRDCCLTFRSIQTIAASGMVDKDVYGLKFMGTKFLPPSSPSIKVFFDDSTFHIPLCLKDVVLENNISFKRTKFFSEISFEGATFAAHVFFEGSTSCGGKINLEKFIEKGGKFDFSHMKGTSSNLEIVGLKGREVFEIIMDGHLPKLEPVTHESG